MNPFEMVVAIIVVVTIGGVLRARYGIRRDKWGNDMPVHDATTIADNKRLQDEVRAMKERIAVLERVVTDNEGSLRLDREIDRLRDDNRI